MVMVGSWVMVCIYECPHKDTNMRMCVCVCVWWVVSICLYILYVCIFGVCV